MNPEVKAAWLKALRSGEYQQAQGWLNVVEGTPPDAFYPGHKGRKIGMCCLGVLCDIAFKDGIVPVWKDGSVLSYGAEQNPQSLPEEVIEWADLETENPLDGVLMRMNDDDGASFEEIADVIEERL